MFLMPGARARQGGDVRYIPQRQFGTQKLQARSNIGIPIGQIPGATTNTTAATGNIGELLTATAAPGTVSLTAVTAKTVTSIPLTAGSWDVTGTIVYTGGGSTTVAYSDASVNTSSNSEGAAIQSFFANNVTYFGSINGSGFQVAAPVLRINSSGGTTTAFLVALANFGSSNMLAGGTIRATRVF